MRFKNMKILLVSLFPLYLQIVAEEELPPFPTSATGVDKKQLDIQKEIIANFLKTYIIDSFGKIEINIIEKIMGSKNTNDTLEPIKNIGQRKIDEEITGAKSPINLTNDKKYKQDNKSDTETIQEHAQNSSYFRNHSDIYKRAMEEKYINELFSLFPGFDEVTDNKVLPDNQFYGNETHSILKVLTENVEEDFYKFGDIVKYKLRLEVDITPIVDKYKALFLDELKGYNSTLSRLSLKNALEKENRVLNAINHANNLMQETYTKLVDDLQKEYLVEEYRTAKAKKHLEYFTIIHRKQKLLKVCNDFHICRDWPTFTGHFKNFIKYLIDIPDERFIYVIHKASELVTTAPNALQIIADEKNLNNLREKISVDFKEIHDKKQLLVNAWVLINERYDFLGENKDKNIIISARNLLNMVDKAFKSKGQDFLEIYWNMITSAVKDWINIGAGNTYIDRALETTVKQFTHTLNHVWDEETRLEAQYLWNYLLTTSSNPKYDYLFTSGPNYMKKTLINEHHV